VRNYYEVLELDRSATADTISKSVSTLSAEHLEDEGDLSEILEDNQWRSHYQKLHLQYEAIAAALQNPALMNCDMQSANSHQWEKRVVEFEPLQNTIEL